MDPQGLEPAEEMIEFAAHKFVKSFSYLREIITLVSSTPDESEADRLIAKFGDNPRLETKHLRTAIARHGEIKEKAIDSMTTTISGLREECLELGLESSVAQIDRIMEMMSSGAKSPSVLPLFNDLSNRIEDELRVAVVLKLNSADRRRYMHPLESWKEVLQRFEAIAFDVEEAGKSLALERYTACVFHLMRVTECAVLDLQCFLDEPNRKAHFGSVLSKLEQLHTKTKFDDLPERLKPHRQFLVDILPQLHAVKDSWRNKVSHFEEKSVPTGTFTRELALGVYDATLLLMKKLADGLPRTH